MDNYINTGLAICTRETPDRYGKRGAVKCQYVDDKSLIWVPKSCLNPGGDIRRTGDMGDLEVKDWFFEKEALSIHIRSMETDTSIFDDDDTELDLRAAKTVYRRIVTEIHPDHCKSITPTEAMTAVNELWQEMMKAVKRK